MRRRAADIQALERETRNLVKAEPALARLMPSCSRSPASDRWLPQPFSLANIVAMGVSARNIVLVGDQMRLSQPIQGTHPGRSGLSALEHVLDGAAAVPPEREIFLGRTRRMHPDLCPFVSEAFYDGRLLPAEGNELQCLILDWGTAPRSPPRVFGSSASSTQDAPSAPSRRRPGFASCTRAFSASVGPTVTGWFAL
ncbi:MAG: hypothetical protein ACREFA_05325 [Stellaceae bacterium]